MLGLLGFASETHSSRITRVRGVTQRRMSLVSDNSTMNVDLPRPRSSDAPIRLLSALHSPIRSWPHTSHLAPPALGAQRSATHVCTASCSPNTALLAGTKLPICAIHTISAIARTQLLFPAIFGPVITLACPSSSLNLTSKGT